MKRVLMALILAAGTGCAETEPYQNPYGWTATGSNSANLAAMAEPGDLARGRGLQGSDGQPAASAIERWRSGHLKSIDTTGTTGGNGGGGTGTGASAGATN